MKLKSFEVSDRSVICPTHPLNFFGCVVNPIKNGRQRERLYVFIWIPTGPRPNQISTRILSLYSFCHFLETIYFLFLWFLSRSWQFPITRLLWPCPPLLHRWWRVPIKEERWAVGVLNRGQNEPILLRNSNLRNLWRTDLSLQYFLIGTNEWMLNR